MIEFDPLWNTMKEKKISKYFLVHKKGIAQATITRLSRNMSVTTATINDLCEILDCDVDDIMKYVPESQNKID